MGQVFHSWQILTVKQLRYGAWDEMISWGKQEREKWRKMQNESLRNAACESFKQSLNWLVSV